MIQKLDKKVITKKTVEPNEGERTFLSSNNIGVRSPSLDFLDTGSVNVSKEMILDYLAQIISEMYLQEVHGIFNSTTKESSDLLPGINQGTS